MAHGEFHGIGTFLTDLTVGRYYVQFSFGTNQGLARRLVLK